MRWGLLVKHVKYVKCLLKILFRKYEETREMKTYTEV